MNNMKTMKTKLINQLSGRLADRFPDRLLKLPALSVSKIIWLALAGAVLFCLSCNPFWVGSGSGMSLFAPAVFILLGSFGFLMNCADINGSLFKKRRGGNILEEYPYTCTNGTPVGGTSLGENIERCDVCDAGFIEEGDSCLPLPPPLPLDILVVDTNNSVPSELHTNDGTGMFAAAPDQLMGTGGAMGRERAGVALGDLDGDGDLDAFVVNYNQANQVYINDGSAGFTVRDAQSMGAPTLGSRGVALGDLDNDGDLDAFVVNYNQVNQIYTNEGNDSMGMPVFTSSPADTGVTPNMESSRRVFLGDLDDDGDLDVVVANDKENVGGSQYGIGRVYINTTTTPGTITFNTSIKLESPEDSFQGVSLGDLDSDGDLDIFVASYEYDGLYTYSDSNLIYINTTTTPDMITFATPIELMASNYSTGVALGNLDSDSDLDALVVNSYTTTEESFVYINTTPMGGPLMPTTFTGQEVGMPTESNNDVVLGDLNGDGFLDAFVTSQKNIYTNDGSAVFAVSPMPLLGAATGAAALGHFRSKELNFTNPSSTKCIETSITEAIEIEVTLADGTMKTIKGLCPKVH